MPTHVNDTIKVALTDAVLLSNNTPCKDYRYTTKSCEVKSGTAWQQNTMSRTVTLYKSVGSIIHAKHTKERGIVPSTLYSTVK